jgi:ubiquinol-cytochrome c reductase cytochrome c1 subunit
MIRIFSILIGAFFTVVLGFSFVKGAIATAGEGLPHTVESRFVLHPEGISFPSDGAFGKFDNQQLQRGFAVYQAVCQSCHALKQVAFRDLKAIGYNEDEVKAIAKGYQIPDYNKNTGELKTRPGLPTDKFPPVLYAGTGNPPDLSLVTKARHGGGAYVAALLQGYKDPATYKNEEGEALPKENFPGNGLHFNPYFANLNIAMPPPLAEGAVTYSDGTQASVKQQAEDVSAFLIWTAEPKLDKRKQTGWPVLGFLLFATVLAYLSKRSIWADKH